MAAFCLAPARVDVWRRAIADSAGQLQRVLSGHTDLQSASELIEQEIYFATQTFSGAVKEWRRQVTGNDQAGCRCQAVVATLLRQVTDVSVARSP